jgi:hypothetical protein
MTMKADHLIQAMQSYNTAREVIDWLKDNGFAIPEDTKALAYRFIKFDMGAPIKDVIDMAIANGCL